MHHRARQSRFKKKNIKLGPNNNLEVVMLKERLGLIGSSSFPAKIIYSKWERIYCRILSFKRDIYATICMVHGYFCCHDATISRKQSLTTEDGNGQLVFE